MKTGSSKRSIWHYMDYLLISLSVLAAVMGIIAIYSATYSFSNGTRMVTVQSAALVIGIVAVIVISLLDYNLLGDLSKVIYVGNIALLVLVLIIGMGRESTGTQGWIDLGPVSIQPSEFVKLGFIITFAKHLERKKEDVNYIPTLLTFLLHAGILVALVLLQPDAGTAMVFAFIFVSMLFVAGLNYKYIIATFLTAVAAIAVIWYFRDVFLTQIQIDRILVFFDPYRDPADTGYNVIQSEISIGSGQLFGKGFLQGTQNQLEYLPSKHTDFIFATIGEEWGFVGSVLVIAVLVAIILRCIYVAKWSSNMFGMLICTGVAAMFGFHVIENIGMCLQLMPVTGIPLPFFSYGGSSLVTSFMAIGLVNSVRIRRRGIYF